MALRSLLAVSAAALLAACAASPDYLRPALDVPPAYKETGAWKTAEPLPADSRTPWWQRYGDPALDALMHDAEAANQNLRQAEAQYRGALAAVDIARSGLFPTLGANLGGDRARTDTNANTNANATGVHTGNGVTLGASASWEPDLWGAVRRDIESGEAGAQASADDLAAAHLSIQGTLAQDYLQLRITDQQRDLYAVTLEAYQRALRLTQAQHAAGVTLLSDVALAQSQLATAQAAATDLEAQRAQLEHAIALLTGRAPAQFSLAPVARYDVQLPASPATLPSQLLEHRPDIAAAERRVALANANIGVASAAYFPALTLSASGGFSAASLGALLDTPGRVWSVGAALAQTIFDGGLRKGRDAQAVAAYDASVALYKQTVLTGFQQVEDQLATLRILERESAQLAQAVQAAQLAERLSLSQYRAGTTTYLSVVTAQTQSLTNQRTAVELRGRQLAASVSLITATGGGWNDTDPAGLPATTPAAGAPPAAPPAAPTTTSIPSTPARASPEPTT